VRQPSHQRNSELKRPENFEIFASNISNPMHIDKKNIHGHVAVTITPEVVIATAIS
jgi:hypothetical protein